MNVFGEGGGGLEGAGGASYLKLSNTSRVDFSM